MALRKENYQPSIIGSLIFHALVLAVLIINIQFFEPRAVVKNEDNSSHVISAIAVNAPDAPVAPTPLAAPPVKSIPKKVIQPQAAPKAPPVAKPDVIAIPQKKVIKKKEVKKDISKEFLADIQQETKKTKITSKSSIEKAMEQEMKEQAAKSLQQQLLAEQKRAAGAKALGVQNKYKALIVEAISRRWLVPAGANKKLYSELLIHLAPGGAVLDVQISRSSGDIALDRSARDAVFKASPLPVPAASDEFNMFRNFVLKVRPENIVENDA